MSWAILTFSKNVFGRMPHKPRRSEYVGWHMREKRVKRLSNLFRSEPFGKKVKRNQERGVSTGIHYPVANHQQPAITLNLPRAA